ncbi:glutamate receptor ionotropic, delta-1 [Caerostris darwini]|uniref:Glutamate receptor ionotropic, delta-1 n=1 Tax=Caerostris darwini TaxID=1538125 RepID=A0AAV4SVJ3_9ARAC|nr:glutamate receptor ionotropic, delta-1 [Caerostris darwini]
MEVEISCKISWSSGSIFKLQTIQSNEDFHCRLNLCFPKAKEKKLMAIMAFPAEMRVGYIPNMNLFETQIRNGKLELGGIEGRFLNLLSQALRFKYHLKPSVDGESGRLDDNGSWTGLFGMIQRKEIDMALSTLSITEERTQVADFSDAYTSKDLTFIVEKPGALPARWALIYPFDITTWICIIVTLIIGPYLFKFFISLKISYKILLFQLWGSFLKQPLTIKFISVQGIVLQISWCVLALLISMFYSSMLLSFLTVPLEKEPIKNFLELSQAVKKGTYRCFSVKGSSMFNILQSSNQEYLRYLGNIMEEKRWFYDMNNMAPILNSKVKVAAIDNRFKLELIQGTLKHDSYVVSKDVVVSLNFAIPLRKDFCCKAKLNTIISRLQSAGLYFKLTREEKLRVFLMSKKEFDDNSIVLSLRDLSGALMFYSFGCVASLIALLSEIVYFRYNNKR